MAQLWKSNGLLPELMMKQFIDAYMSLTHQGPDTI